jgi:hypothetical protein
MFKVLFHSFTHTCRCDCTLGGAAVTSGRTSSGMLGWRSTRYTNSPYLWGRKRRCSGQNKSIAKLMHQLN